MKINIFFFSFILFKKLNLFNAYQPKILLCDMKILQKMSSTIMMSRVYIPRIDIYNGITLSKKISSIEHIIPKKFFNNKEDANDLLNLGHCHVYINNCRSDYKYGLLKNNNNNNNTKCIYTPNQNISSGSIDTKKRIFYLNENADIGLISRSCLSMLYKYPYLYKYIDDIIHDKELLEIGSKYPKLEYEIWREQTLMEYSKSKIE
jgi:hypothetical protein